ncbi:PREDICTED: tachykinins [Ceratosolen solmsi marchali]|uniref:Tachykinins n=1 Tax=Ceratosolen solmsi marchali TaxID=326594 RepID=A0AAJ6YS63_9HYME|nr:PREDICTED: tachykinins [Ceratosolen solmsi marchali]
MASALAEHSAPQIVQKITRDLTHVESSKLPDPRFDLNKYQELHEANNKHLRVPDSYLERLLLERMEKRSSMRGFQGMRGKKNEFDLPPFFAVQIPESSYNGLGNYYNKRARMGFQGMRGKKDLEEMLNEMEKRSKMGFQGMRGKKSENYEEQEPQIIEEYRKRAPMGFQGMRGRKSSFLEELDELEKRALLGFHGMRGKKDIPYEREQIPMDIDGYVEKRPMMMGFHGMRGKRNTNYYEQQQ